MHKSTSLTGNRYNSECINKLHMAKLDSMAGGDSLPQMLLHKLVYVLDGTEV